MVVDYTQASFQADEKIGCVLTHTSDQTGIFVNLTLFGYAFDHIEPVGFKVCIEGTQNWEGLRAPSINN
jgi:hypothetical protein